MNATSCAAPCQPAASNLPNVPALVSAAPADDCDAASDISSEEPPSTSAAGGHEPSSGTDAFEQHRQQQPARSCWASLPSSLQSLSLHGFALDAAALQGLGAAAPQLQHLRLLHCSVSSGLMWVLARAVPRLASLAVKEAPLAGIGTSGVAAVAALQRLRALALTLEPHVDVSLLAELTGLRYLLLDGRANTELAGVKALRRLCALRALVLPLLHLHHANRGLLVALTLALPNTAISNISANFGMHHGCQWYKSFSLAEREWWREPDVPWHW
ncbi:hypothetical protein COO60DRAFT_191669 [Scenedesmus sp. NREL 46B-D3]|nr:hypothetical protein COO60DRAFT_191669 [Scenedesmus sp. NREL 46B-D3]